MQTVARRARRLAKQDNSFGAALIDRQRDFSRYPHPLQFYATPPQEEISLEEFETLAVDRLRVLKAVEQAKIRWPKRGEEYTTYLKNVIKTHLPMRSADDEESAEAAYDERRKDHLSHFVLRLAYCKSEDLRRWLLQQEADLFRFRLEHQYSASMLDFLHLHNLAYSPVDPADRQALLPYLRNSAPPLSRWSDEDVLKTTFYQVPFEQALELVRVRRAFVRGGQVYVPQQEMMPIIVGTFRMRLSAALAITARALPQLEEDDRLLPMLNTLSKQYLGKSYSNSTSTTHDVTAASIPSLATESFPLCMRTMQEALQAKHHLKHGARLQYGLFLKGIGLTLEEAMLFWRSEFSKAMSTDKFDKSYAYNIRHNYGKEGKRTEYTPYSCMKIIMGTPPGSGDDHGCPFRHHDGASLRLRLAAYKLPAASIQEIDQLVKDHHYQVACGRYFEATHRNAQPVAIQHPNQYFDESRKLLTGGSESTAKSAKTADSAEKAKEGGGQSDAAGSDAAGGAGTGDVVMQGPTDDDLAAMDFGDDL